jgi:lipoprotein-anchoring transpeptidase ErfK/SrfK
MKRAAPDTRAPDQMMHRSPRFALLLTTLIVGTLSVAAAAPARPPLSDGELALTASIGARTITVTRGSEVVKTYAVAVGADRHPTPKGRFMIRKIVWNPAWVPPDAKWAKGKEAKDPGHPENPMKLVKLFFQEPDYYIHGTDAVESLGQAASHGCLRMDPDEAGELALMVMNNDGIVRDWDWVKGLLHLGETRTVSLRMPTPIEIVP